MSGFKAPEHTQVPNSFFDMMDDMSDVELRVTLCAIRKTFGWHKKKEAISLTQYQKMTGLSRQGVLNGIEEAEKRGTIKKAGTGKRNTTIYELVVLEPEPKTEKEAEKPPVQETDQSTQLTTASQHSRPELVNTVDTQKKGKKKKETITAAQVEKPKTSNEMYEAVKEVFGLHGGLNADYQKFLIGIATKKQYKPYNLEPATNPDELRLWAIWYRRTVLSNDNTLSMVASPAKIQSSILEYREKQVDVKPVSDSQQLEREAGEAAMYKLLIGDSA